MELFNQTDYGRIGIEEIERLVARLKETPSWKDQVDHRIISGWIVSGWKHIDGHFEEDQKELAEDAPACMTSFATVWARLTRDLAAVGLGTYQDALRPAISLIVKILWTTSAAARLDHPHFKAFNQFSLQALANLNTLNSSSIRHTWPLLVHCEDRQSILLRFLYNKNNKLLLTVGVLMLNCVHGNPERIDSLIETSVGNKAMTMLLERLDGLLDDEREVVFEVIVKLVREIMDIEPISQVPRLYDSQATPSQVLSPGQLCILKVLESSDLPTAPSFLVPLFKRLSTRLDQTWQGFVLVIHLLVSCIQNHLPFPSQDILSYEDINSLLEISLRTLKDLSDAQQQLIHPNHIKHKRGEDEGTEKKRRLNQMMIGLVKLVTNMIELQKKRPSDHEHQPYGPTCIQDSVRTRGGLPVILNLTKFDVDFPYLSEHSVLLLKFLLENNPQNQAVIQNLQQPSSSPST